MEGKIEKSTVCLVSHGYDGVWQYPYTRKIYFKKFQNVGFLTAYF